ILDDRLHSGAIRAEELLLQYKEEDLRSPGNVLDVAQPIVLAGGERIGGGRICFTLFRVRGKIAEGRRYALFFGVGFALMGALVFALMGRHLVKPINDLVKGTQLIASGDLNTKIEVASKDELGVLAESFNQMAVSLKENQAALEEAKTNLEQKVAE